MISSRKSCFREEEEPEVFESEFPDVSGVKYSKKMKLLGDAYSALFYIEKTYPDLLKGINRDDYLGAMRVLRDMWFHAGGRSLFDTKHDLYRTEGDYYPEDGSFITCSRRYVRGDGTGETWNPWNSGNNEIWSGVYSSNEGWGERRRYLDANKYPVEKSGIYPLITINFVKGEEVHPFEYFPKIDFLLEKESYPIKNIIRWRYDDETLLKWYREKKWIPEEVIDEVASKDY